MYKFLNKNGQTLAFGLGVLVTIIFMLGAFPSAGDFDFENMTDEEVSKVGIFDFGLKAAIALAVIAAVALVLFGIYHIATNLKGSLKGLIGVAALVILFFIAYSTADGVATGSIAGAVEKFAASGNGSISEGNLKFIGGAITTTAILVVGAAASFVISEIINFFR